VWICSATTLGAQLVINEILFNPPGPDTNSEYVELRGPPNAVLSNGTYLVEVEGDVNGNPGTVQNVFDLSGRAIGGNGFLVLMQKLHNYSPTNSASIITNSDVGPGFGSGSGSSIDHDGEGGQTDLENPSCTFFLIQTTNAPALGADIDVENDGVPDGIFTNWTVLDSVGVLDDTGLGDIAYGAINFRRDANPGRQAAASGVIVPVPFTASYIGRTGNSTGSLATAWVASDNLGGAAPVWILGAKVGTVTNTIPLTFTNKPLNHVGAPNFGAPAIPGVVIAQSGGDTQVSESGGTDSYTIALTVAPAGPVSIRITAGPQLQISTNGGTTFLTSVTLSFNNTTQRTITVRAEDDNVVDAATHFSTITNVMTATGDATKYPLGTLVPDVRVGIQENDTLLLSEVKVNPPGADAANEYVEIKGAPGALLTNVYLVAIDGSMDPGVANLVVNLSGQSLGGSGLLLIAGLGHPYNVPAGTALFIAPQFGNVNGALDNQSISILLVSSRGAIDEGEDLDAGDNGVLEGLPGSATILDVVGWTDGGGNDIVYGGVDLTQPDFTPDAAVRFPGNDTPRSAAAWFCGDLAGSSGDSLRFSSGSVSPNFPPETLLTPGAINNTAPSINPNPVAPLSHVIGDPMNPNLIFTVADAETSAGSLAVTVVSTNEAVVPTANLTVTIGPGGLRTLALNPVGVGYSDIILTVSDGAMTGRAVLHYAASAMGRPNGVWLTGISDASTAYAIDSNWMIVGDDENQILRLFNRTRSGGPVGQLDMNPFLNLVDLYEDGTPKEVDFEGSTHVGNRIYWLGSHSHGLNAAAKTNRARLFATDISGAGTNIALAFTAHYDFLKVDLIAWDANNLHGRGSNYYGLVASAEIGVDAKAPDGSGFNIEGLAMAPGSTAVAYLGFRAPLVSPANRAKALIVPVNNFATLAANGGGPGSAIFGPPIELNLGCRGIRSIEGDSNGYVVVAGPPGPATGIAPYDFRLFTWTGQPNDPPQERAADLTGLNPEGIIELPPGPWSSATDVQLLSDNGTNIYYNDGIPAKQLTTRNFKKFRCDWITLGPVVRSALVIRSFALNGNIATLSWCSIAGTTYRVQTKTDLGNPVWTDVNGDVLAADAVAEKVFSITLDPQRFFRIVSLP
jgi:hypothetical protein